MTAAKIQAKGFREAWAETLYGGPHNLKTLAGEAQMSSKTLSGTADAALDEWISMRKFIGIYPHCSNFAVLDWLEARVGRVAFRVPEADACTTRVCAEFMRSAAALLEKKAAALDNGVMEPCELREIQTLIDDVMRRAAAIGKRAEQMLGEAEAA
jgi:hypothetical protein